MAPKVKFSARPKAPKTSKASGKGGGNSNAWRAYTGKGGGRYVPSNAPLPD